MRAIKKYVGMAVGFGLIAIMVMGASSCDPNAATTSAMCAFIVGDGEDGHDAKVHDVLPPNKQIHVDSGE